MYHLVRGEGGAADQAVGIASAGAGPPLASVGRMAQGLEMSSSLRSMPKGCRPTVQGLTVLRLPSARLGA